MVNRKITRKKERLVSYRNIHKNTRKINYKQFGSGPFSFVKDWIKHRNMMVKFNKVYKDVQKQQRNLEKITPKLRGQKVTYNRAEDELIKSYNDLFIIKKLLIIHRLRQIEGREDITSEAGITSRITKNNISDARAKIKTLKSSINNTKKIITSTGKEYMSVFKTHVKKIEKFNKNFDKFTNFQSKNEKFVNIKDKYEQYQVDSETTSKDIKKTKKAYKRFENDYNTLDSAFKGDKYDELIQQRNENETLLAETKQLQESIKNAKKKTGKRDTALEKWEATSEKFYKSLTEFENIKDIISVEIGYIREKLKRIKEIYQETDDPTLKQNAVTSFDKLVKMSSDIEDTQNKLVNVVKNIKKDFLNMVPSTDLSDELSVLRQINTRSINELNKIKKFLEIYRTLNSWETFFKTQYGGNTPVTNVTELIRNKYNYDDIVDTFNNSPNNYFVKDFMEDFYTKYYSTTITLGSVSNTFYKTNIGYFKLDNNNEYKYSNPTIYSKLYKDIKITIDSSDGIYELTNNLCIIKSVSKEYACFAYKYKFQYTGELLYFALDPITGFPMRHNNFKIDNNPRPETRDTITLLTKPDYGGYVNDDKKDFETILYNIIKKEFDSKDNKIIKKITGDPGASNYTILAHILTMDIKNPLKDCRHTIDRYFEMIDNKNTNYKHTRKVYELICKNHLIHKNDKNIGISLIDFNKNINNTSQSNIRITGTKTELDLLQERQRRDNYVQLTQRLRGINEEGERSIKQMENDIFISIDKLIKELGDKGQEQKLMRFSEYSKQLREIEDLEFPTISKGKTIEDINRLFDKWDISKTMMDRTVTSSSDFIELQERARMSPPTGDNALARIGVTIRGPASEEAKKWIKGQITILYPDVRIWLENNPGLIRNIMSKNRDILEELFTKTDKDGKKIDYEAVTKAQNRLAGAVFRNELKLNDTELQLELYKMGASLKNKDKKDKDKDDKNKKQSGSTSGGYYKISRKRKYKITNNKTLKKRI